MGTGWCPDCRAFVPAAGGECGECRRRQAWGLIVTALHRWHAIADHESQVVGGELNDVLGAVGFLMQDRQALIHQHRREMRDEDRAAQRGARDSYDQGRDEGRREGRGDW
jgi:hypothetical protein